MTITVAKNPEQAVKDIIDIIDALRGVYEEETKALESLDTKSFYALQSKKITVAQNYQDGIQNLIARKEEMKSIPRPLKQKLQDMQNSFHVLAETNRDALSRMNRLTKRLADTIHRAARESVEKNRTRQYSNNGHMQEMSKKTLSMSINETA